MASSPGPTKDLTPIKLLADWTISLSQNLIMLEDPVIEANIPPKIGLRSLASSTMDRHNSNTQI
jgi:hypothetical protein